MTDHKARMVEILKQDPSLTPAQLAARYSCRDQDVKTKTIRRYAGLVCWARDVGEELHTPDERRLEALEAKVKQLEQQVNERPTRQEVQSGLEERLTKKDIRRRLRIRLSGGNGPGGIRARLRWVASPDKIEYIDKASATIQLKPARYT